MPAVRLGRHDVRIYTTKTRCAVRSELQRKVQPCVHVSFCVKDNISCHLALVVVPFVSRQVVPAIRFPIDACPDQSRLQQ